MAASIHAIQVQESSVIAAAKFGAIAGLGGGLVFGVMMGMVGLPAESYCASSSAWRRN